jgi:type I restriction enzyme R subunit
VVDKQFINQRFATHGGTKMLNKVLDDQLDAVLEEVNDALWAEQA